MKFANVREHKSKTSAMLKTVERGNTVLVTTHGLPTAMLVPVTEDDIEDILWAHSAQLRRRLGRASKIFGLEGQWHCPSIGKHE